MANLSLNGGGGALSELEVETYFIEAQSNQEALGSRSILLNQSFDLFKRIKFGLDDQYSNLIFRR